MKTATKIFILILCIYGSLLGIVHGVFTLSQGAARPSGVLFSAIGPPCQPSQHWHACLPALTIFPNLRSAGVSAVIASVLLLLAGVWVEKMRAVWAFVFLAGFLLLISGGGFIAFFISFFAALGAVRLRSFHQQEKRGFLAKLAFLWPWIFLVYLAGIPLQWFLGAVNNRLMLSLGSVILPLEFLLLTLSLLSAWGHDAALNHG